MTDQAVVMWESSFRHAEGLVRWLIAEDPAWWRRVQQRSIDAEMVIALLTYGIWGAQHSVVATASVLRPDGPAPALDDLEFGLVSRELSIDPLTAMIRADAQAPDKLPDPAAMTGVLEIAADPQREEQWRALARITLGVLVGHFVRSGVDAAGSLTLGERRVACAHEPSDN